MLGNLRDLREVAAAHDVAELFADERIVLADVVAALHAVGADVDDAEAFLAEHLDVAAHGRLGVALAPEVERAGLGVGELVGAAHDHFVLAGAEVAQVEGFFAAGAHFGLADGEEALAHGVDADVAFLQFVAEAQGEFLGEYSALVASGVIDFKDAVPLVRLRAAAMQEAVPLGTGAMAAILGLDTPSIVAACIEAANGQVVEPVNFNANGQTVIAGHKEAVERAMDACKARGAKMAKALPVSAPFHSSLIRPAADKLASRLAELNFKEPQIPVVNNVDVAIETDPARIKDALIRQAFNPVRWVETIQKMAVLGVLTVVECGPGKVLAGLTKRCADGVVGVAMADVAAIEANLGLE